ncbi:MAG: thioredoxin [gamma proteobacterium endosymbiont of Lamellibrachia anaximandri]|nr:thioredoxin [gamma proteobacterium endosymbiont of Lamellibrachia anaximandri]MBL3532654.1 thioredoxin [gamma proteobacterium endosymbiont of Lamellibrachia anaximandri]MBL3599022.1 thioredoxin [gamma proteobacterium endosymbiont of Lamellibrachia anaximandri]
MNLFRKTVFGALLGLTLAGSVGQLGAASSGGVTVYRCQLPEGDVTFQQIPCVSGEQQQIRIVNRSAGLSPVEPALRLQRTKQKKASKRRSKATKTRRKRSEEKRCWAKRKKLEKVEKRLRAGYKASQSDKLHRQQADYEDYLKQFCRT